MKTNLNLTLILLTFRWKSTEPQTSKFEALLPLYRFSLDTYMSIFGRISENPQNLRLVQQLNKLQPRINNNIPFPCSLNNTRSKTRPTSVHSLRPGDIDVIAGIGDSVTAGQGGAATNVFHIILQNRGLSPTAGGQGTWRQYLTLPNILKEFNPNLIGYSVTDSYLNHKESQFNIGEALALSRDMPFMANQLIKRMKNDARVNFKTDWKLISYLIGPNNFCSDLCYQKDLEAAVEMHRKYLRQTFRKLRDNLPRTIVNLIVVMHVKVLRETTIENRPPICYLVHNMFCSCLFGLKFQNQQQRLDKMISKWQQVEIEVAKEPEFDTDNFTVIAQPFAVNYNFAKTATGLTDYSALAPDCFHLSQKEAARAALSLWKNMLEPVGEKTETPSQLFHFKCPTADHPFIFTRRNSVYNKI